MRTHWGSEPARESVRSGNIFPGAEPFLVQKMPDTGRLVALRPASRWLSLQVTNHVDRHAIHDSGITVGP